MQKKGTRRVTDQVNPVRFWPNLVISGGEPYAEDGWRNLTIGNNYFIVSPRNIVEIFTFFQKSC